MLSNLSGDTVFGPANIDPPKIDMMTREDETTFRDIFMRAPITEGYIAWNRATLMQMKSFAENHPSSRFFDDAVFLIVTAASWEEGPESNDSSFSGSQLERLLDLLGARQIELEPFTQAEIGEGLAAMARHYGRTGTLKTLLTLLVAEIYRFSEDDRDASGRLAVRAQKLYPSFDESPNSVMNEAQRLALLMPEHQKFEASFDDALLAIDRKDWAKASNHLEIALSHESAYRPCNIAIRCGKNPPAAWYLLGSCRFQMAQWRQARDAMENMLQLAPDYHTMMLFTPAGETIEVHADIAQSYVVASYLEEGLWEKGLEEGRKLLAKLQENPEGEDVGQMIELAHYNLACAHALLGNEGEALRHARETLLREPRWAPKLEADEDLKLLKESGILEALIRRTEEDRRAIVELQQTKELSQLREALDDPSPFIRMTAVQGLGGLRRTSPPAEELLLQQLEDPSALVRYSALRELSYGMKKGSVLAVFTAMLRDPSWGIRSKAAYVLGGKFDDANYDDLLNAIARLLEALDDPVPRVRETAAYALREIADELKGKEALRLRSEDQTTDTLREANLHNQLYKRLVSLLEDADADVRQQAVWALGSLGDARAVGHLVNLLGDSILKFPAAVAISRMSHNPEISEAALRAVRSQEIENLLIEALHDGDASVREAAAWVMGTTGNGLFVAPLMTALAQEEVYSEAPMVEALGKIDDPRATATLIRLIRHPDAEVRLSAVRALKESKRAGTIPALEEALDDDAEEVRRAALAVLDGQASSGSMVESIAWMVLDQREATAVRKKAMGELGKTGKPVAVEPLMRVLFSEEEQSLRNAASKALRAMTPDVLANGLKSADGPWTSPVLPPNDIADALCSEDWKVRMNAVQELGKLKDLRFGLTFLELIEDEHPRVRGKAIQALRSIQDPRAMEVLIKSLMDPDKRVRSDAAYAFTWYPGALTALIEMLEDPATPNRDAVANAIGKCREMRGAAILLDALHDEDADVRAAAAGALGWIGDASFAEPLMDSLSGDVRKVRESAAWALQHIRNPISINALIAAMSDESPLVRSYSASGLAAMEKNEHSVEALRKALDDPSPGVRSTAKRALERWGEKNQRN